MKDINILKQEQDKDTQDTIVEYRHINPEEYNGINNVSYEKDTRKSVKEKK